MRWHPASKRRDRYGPWVRPTGAPTSSFATVPHDLHRLRRGALNPFFSKRAITKVEPLIVDRIERLCGRFSSVTETNKVIRLDHAYMTLTMDVVTHCCYGTSFDYLKEEGYRASWKESVIAKMASCVVLRQFPATTISISTA